MIKKNFGAVLSSNIPIPLPSFEALRVLDMLASSMGFAKSLQHMNPFLLKTLHLLGVFALFASLGASLLASARGKFASVLHGISLVLILLVGFAMLRKPPMDQSWWMVKLALWLFIGLAPLLAKRQLLPGAAVFALTLAAAAVSSWLGLAKPF